MTLKSDIVLFSWPKAARPDVDDVVQALEFHRAVHRQVGPRAARQLARQLDVDRHGSVGGRGVDA